MPKIARGTMEEEVPEENKAFVSAAMEEKELEKDMMLKERKTVSLCQKEKSDIYQAMRF